MDPKLQVWDHSTQTYCRAPMASTGITYKTRDIEVLAAEIKPKNLPKADPIPPPQEQRQKGRWSEQTGYTPTKQMPPFEIDPDAPLPG